MIISFRNLNIRKICEDEIKASQVLGKEVTEKLKNRLSDIDSAETINHILVGNPSPQMYEGIKNFRFKINLYSSYSFMIEPNHKSIPMTGEMVDWSKVNRVKVIEFLKNDSVI